MGHTPYLYPIPNRPISNWVDPAFTQTQALQTDPARPVLLFPLYLFCLLFNTPQVYCLHPTCMHFILFPMHFISIVCHFAASHISFFYLCFMHFKLPFAFYFSLSSHFIYFVTYYHSHIYFMSFNFYLRKFQNVNRLNVNNLFFLSFIFRRFQNVTRPNVNNCLFFVIYFIADLRMYNRSYVIALGICVRACVYVLPFISLPAQDKGPRGGPTPP